MNIHHQAPPTTPTQEPSSTRGSLGMMAIYVLVAGVVLGTAIDRLLVDRALSTMHQRVEGAELQLKDCNDALGDALRLREVEWR